MGPRLFSRGDTARYCDYNHAYNLQWDRGSSAAETATRSIEREPVPRLQWDRGSSAAETRLAAHEGAGAQGPSMGPRLFSRGDGRSSSRPRPGTSFNGTAALQPRRRHRELPADDRVVPSMGPRLFSRGDSLLLGCDLKRERPSMGPRLFSRGDGHQATPRCTAEPFNGTAALQPRRLPPSRDLSLQAVGRGSASVGWSENRGPCRPDPGTSREGGNPCRFGLRERALSPPAPPSRSRRRTRPQGPGLFGCQRER